MSKYKYLFFDFDGTLTNTYEGIAKILDITFEHYNYAIDKSEYPKFIGPPLNETFAKLLGADIAYEAVDVFRKHYVDNQAIYMTKVYEGIEQCLIDLKKQGYTINVATCKKQEEAEHLLEYFGLKKHIDFVSGLCYTIRETKQEILSYAMEKLGYNVDECLMIGDTQYDAEGALALNMDCALCLWGFGDYDNINHSNIVVRVATPEELTEFLR